MKFRPRGHHNMSQSQHCTTTVWSIFRDPNIAAFPKAAGVSFLETPQQSNLTLPRNSCKPISMILCPPTNSNTNSELEHQTLATRIPRGQGQLEHATLFCQGAVSIGQFEGSCMTNLTKRTLLPQVIGEPLAQPTFWTFFAIWMQRGEGKSGNSTIAWMMVSWHHKTIDISIVSCRCNRRVRAVLFLQSYWSARCACNVGGLGIRECWAFAPACFSTRPCSLICHSLRHF